MGKVAIACWTLLIPCTVFICGTIMPFAAHVYFRSPDQAWADILSWKTNAMPCVMQGIVYFLTAYLIRTVNLKAIQAPPHTIRLVHGRCLGAMGATFGLGLMVNAVAWTAWYANAGILFVLFPLVGIGAMMAGLILGGMITRFRIESTWNH